MRSIFGECSGNVRSTPTPKDCFRTVKVSRAPAPWRLRTMPSQTWIRARWPSITLKCTLTVSPALNCGMSSRIWARSIDSITLLIGKAALRTGRGMLPKMDPFGSALDLDDLAADVRQRNKAPDAGVTRRAPIVAQNEVHARRVAVERPAGRNVLHRERSGVSPRRRHVRLRKVPAVDVDRAALLLPAVTGKTDHSLDEEPARAALQQCTPRRLEDDDVAPAGFFVLVRNRVDQVPAGGLAARGRLAAMKRRLHRRRRDTVDMAPTLLRAARCEQEHREQRGPVHQWNEMRLGGQYVAKTLPIRFFFGTRPQTRESHDDFRLSP